MKNISLFNVVTYKDSNKIEFRFAESRYLLLLLIARRLLFRYSFFHSQRSELICNKI